MVFPIAPSNLTKGIGRRSMGEDAIPVRIAEINPQRRSLLALAPSENFFHSAQIFLGIHTHTVVSSLPNLNRNSVLQEAQLLEPLAAFQRRLRQRAEAMQRWLAISVKAEMLKIDRVRMVAIVRNSGARKIKRISSKIGDNLHGVGIIDIF